MVTKEEFKNTTDNVIRFSFLLLLTPMNEENLRAENAQLRQQLDETLKRIHQLEKENKELAKENEKLRRQLRQFLNENTPSSALPLYMKKELAKAVAHRAAKRAKRT
ncbi:MAG: hypothetical protein QW171_03530 [Candidatus Bilamarchaeaceae archaeon]